MKYGLAVALLGLVACSPQAQDQIARQAASATITRVVANRYPQLPVEPLLGCVLRHGTGPELDALASDSLTGPTESSARIVANIVTRPETVDCVARGGA